MKSKTHQLRRKNRENSAAGCPKQQVIKWQSREYGKENTHSDQRTYGTVGEKRERRMPRNSLAWREAPRVGTRCAIKVDVIAEM